MTPAAALARLALREKSSGGLFLSAWTVLVAAAITGAVASEAVRRLVIDPLSGPELETLSAAARSIVRSLEAAGDACREHAPTCDESPC